MTDLPLLSLATFLPLLGAAFIFFVRGEPEVVAQNARSVALWTSLATFVLTLMIWAAFDPAQGGFQLVEKSPWLPGLGISYHMGIDGISLWFVLLSALLYTANHVWRFDWGPTEQLRLFCLGLAYAAAAWRWQTLWAAVALHWGWNLGSVLADAVMPVSVVDVSGFRLLSAGAHLLLLALVLLLPRRPVPA